MLFFAIFSATPASSQHLSERSSTLPVVVRTDDNSGNYELKRRDGTIVPGTRYPAIGSQYLCDSYSIRPSCPIPVMNRDKKWGLIDVNGNIITPCIYDYMSIPSGNVIQVSKDGLTGYLDYSGNVIIPLKYASICDSHPFNGYIVANLDFNGSPSYIYDTRGNLVKKTNIMSSTPKECRVRSIFITGNHESGFSLWDAATGKTIAGPHDFLWMDGNLAHFTKGRKEGVLDALTGKTILPAIYDNINPFSGYKYTNAAINGVNKIIDLNGNTVLQLPKGLTVTEDRPIDDAVSSGMIEIADCRSKKHGLIDTKGSILIPCDSYNEIRFIPQNTFISCENGDVTDYYETQNFRKVLSTRYVNNNCVITGNPKLKNALGDSGRDWHVYTTDPSGTIIFSDYNNHQYAIINRDGELLLDGITRIGSQLSDLKVSGIYAVSFDSDPYAAMSLYDATRQQFVSETILDSSIVSIDGNTAIVKLKDNPNKSLFYNATTGTATYRDLGGSPYFMIGDGVMWVSRRNGNDRRDIATDIDGNTLFSLRAGDYSCWRFSEGMCRVSDEKTGFYGFIDRTGRMVIPCDMDYADDFHDGLALFVKDGRAGFIDKSGAVVIPCEFDQATSFENGRAVVKKNGAYGEIDTTGREVIPCIYPNEIMPTAATRRLNTIFMPSE